jgi:hypothetical protein
VIKNILYENWKSAKPAFQRKPLIQTIKNIYFWHTDSIAVLQNLLLREKKNALALGAIFRVDASGNPKIDRELSVTAGITFVSACLRGCFILALTT